jgi:hypothetical protein
MMHYKLYLDDERSPSKSKGWVIVRNVDHAKAMIRSQGLPFEMSLDHDLGENVPTGYDFVKWLASQDYDIRNVKINVHSANPVGSRNIIGFVNNWNNFKESQYEEDTRSCCDCSHGHCNGL